MINRFKKIFSLFADKIDEVILVSEEYDSLCICCSAKELQFPTEKEFLSEISFINQRDSIHLSFKRDGDVIENYSSQNGSDFTELIESLKRDKTRYLESYEIIITLSKKIIDNTLSVYFTDKFISYLANEAFVNFLFIINKLLNSRKFIYLEVQDQNNKINFQTSNICLSNRFDNDIESIVDIKEVRNKQIKNICHSNLLSSYIFIPEDFYPIDLSKNATLNNLFKKATLIYSIIHLFDIVEVHNLNIEYKLNGYKTLFHKTCYEEIDISSYFEYYKIYQWVYSGGSIIDKIGLCRNIISLNLDSNSLKLNDTTFLAIQSGYKIYQKENVKQYIEIRNKISDQLLEIQKNADKIVDDFISDFKKSLFTFVSFFASVIALRIISKENLDDGFSIEVTLLSFAFLAVAFLVMLYRRKEIAQHVTRYKKFYTNLKKRYQDLLDESDISRILNNDKDFNENIHYIQQRISSYSKLWVYSIVIFGIVVSILYVINLCVSHNFIVLIKFLLRCSIPNILV